MTHQASSAPARTWATLAIIGMLSRAVIFAFVVVTEFVAFSWVPDWELRAAKGDLVALAVAFGLGGGVSLAVVALVVAVVGFLVWLYGAVRHAHECGMPHPNTTPGGALVWWFIPFVNLVRPYTVVQSLYQVSRVHAVDSPRDWVGRWPQLLPLWWATWTVGTILTNVSYRLWSHGHLTRGAVWFGVAAAPLMIIAALCAAMVIWSIQTNQEAPAPSEAFGQGAELFRPKNDAC